MLGMISAIFHALVYDPLYNGLVFLVGILPANDVGLAVVLLTIIVRIIIFPLSRRAVIAQKQMKEIAPDLEALKVKYKNNREEQGRAIFALYKERDIHPFASFGLILIQLPILFALYWIFALGKLPAVHTEILYPFVHAPAVVNMEFLGLINVGSKSILLAILAAVTQIIYSRLSMGPRMKSGPSDGTFAGDMAKSFDLQARYVLPVIIGVIAYTIPAAAPLYWVVSNSFMIGQEFFMGRRFRE
ncbi:MAG: YidC/Oxa1 family membrane protein insertase [Candidatus Kaiserbacteria bacterium]|nr:YidC/Oxa1 family membrane protein insertase [Candidatus Kaiserbacteria bacterium]